MLLPLYLFFVRKFPLIVHSKLLQTREGTMADKPTPTPLVQSARTINSAAVGTTPVTGAGAINLITVNQWTNTATDLNTPMTLLDSNGPPAAGIAARVLFSASLAALACLYEPRP